jgi:branched-chain amino acid transport system substrate-binding protein
MRGRKGVLSVTMVLMAFVLVIAPCMSANAQPASKEKTLKIGLVTNFGWSLGFDFKKGVELIAEVHNKRGGLMIGGERYKLDIISVDSKMSHEVSRAAVERLVYQDKVKFIVGDETVDAWVPVTEAAKVLTVAVSPAPAIFNPKYKYAFQGSTLQTDAPQIWGWFAKSNPQIKTILCAFPDDKLGRIRAGLAKKLGEVFGPKELEPIFYPPGQTDLSVVGTRVKSLNPDAFSPTGGGVAGDSLCFKAAWQAGYKGQLFSFVSLTVGAVSAVIPVEAIEGWIAGETAPELASPPPAAKEFKDAYIAKYGKWDSPMMTFMNTFYILLAGLQQAQSLDTDKVANVIGSGMKYEGVNGNGMMVARPDAGNTRTVDTVVPVYMKKVEKGKPQVIGHLSLDEAYQYNKAFYGWK